MVKKRKLNLSVPSGKRKKHADAPQGSDFIRRRGAIFVRVDWEDTTEGASHYSPVSALKCDENIVAGSRVRMKHGG